MEFKKKVIFNDPNSEPPKNGIGQKDKELLEFNYNTKQGEPSKLVINPIKELKKVIVYNDDAPAKNELWCKKGKIYKYSQNSNNGIEDVNYIKIPFTIEALDNGDITGALDDLSVRYSKNGGEGETMDKDTIISVNLGDEIQFKGNNNSYDTKTISSTARFNVKGNIMSLIDEDDFITANTISNRCFFFLFRNCTTIISASNLNLPFKELSQHCFYGMFATCKSLVNAPKLLATTLADYCYSYMFYQCSALKNAPELPATILAPYCYDSMFRECTNLENAPELPATILAPYCYSNMFYQCAALKIAPELPATVLEDQCYLYMFSCCSSLVTAPYLPATTLAYACYRHMFSHCSSIINVQKRLPATDLADRCYASMFRDCAKLEFAPELPATVLTSQCYNTMFYGCTNLRKTPELPALTLVSRCYESLFLDCPNVTQIKAMFTTEPGVQYTQEGVSNVSPNGTFVKNSAATGNVSGIHGIPEGWTVETAEE